MPRSKAKTASEIVAKSNEKRGATSVGLRLLPGDLEFLDRWADILGGRKAAIMAGLHALEHRNEPSNSELIDMLKARLK